MAALLGAIKGGQDRPQDRGDAPYRNASNNSSSVGVASDKQQLQQLQQQQQQQQTSSASHVPQTPTSSDGQEMLLPEIAVPTQPQQLHASPGAGSPTTSLQQLNIRKTQRASRGPPAPNIPSRELEPPQQPQQQQQQQSSQQLQQPLQTPQKPTSANSVQSSSASANTSNIDPLSQHIFLRTNTDPLRNPKLRAHTSGPDIPAPDAPKGFLGRLSMRAGRKKEDANDLASEAGEPRDEGSNAHVFSSIIDSAGFIPHHKEPPRYIRIKVHNKKTKEFDRMFLAQELIGTRPLNTNPDARVPLVTVSTASQGRKKMATGGAVWATEFSKDGKYLAAGGRDHVVRVWQVISTAEDRRQQEEEEAQNEGGADERLSAPVFLEKPVQEFVGHTGEILDLSWSKNNFLLSTSMDKTVRLWHTSRQECLCTFKHKELVSKVAFHPKDDRFFLAGCLDATLRLWSIPDKNVAFSAQLSDMITAVAFSPDGKLAIAGLLNGFCYLLETEGLKPLTQIHVRSSRGRNAKGSKITGIVPIVLPSSRPGDAAILVTSTDARVRLYNLRDKTLDCKFKGHEHASGQLTASFSDDGKHVIVGSEARKVFIWNATPSDSITKDRYPCETFDAHGDMVTTAIFAPVQTRQLLGASGDPIYDLCNPPPIQLMSLEETLASQSGMSNNTRGHDDPTATSTAAAPTASSHPAPPSTLPPLPPPRARPEESPAYIARSTHYDGNIIVTSDDTGIIKVFRQDCAAKKRKHESWETGSSFRGSTNQRLVGRSGSIITRTSASSAAHSRRGSLSMPPSLLTNANANAASPQIGGNQDSINRWRHGIEGGSSGNGISRPNSLIGSGIAPAVARSERSISPNKSSRVPLPTASGLGLASDARKLPYAATMSSPLSPHFAPSQVAGGNGSGSGVVSPATTRQQQQQPAKPSIATPGAETAKAAASNAPTKKDEPPPGDDSAHSATRGAAASKDQAGDEGNANKLKPDHDERDFASPSSPASTTAPRSPVSDDDNVSSRGDASGSGFGFFNLNRWKGIAGLRTSLIGGSSNESNTRPSSQQEPSSPVDDQASSDGEQSPAKSPHHSRRKSLGLNGSLLPKSPLSRSETPTEAAGAADSSSNNNNNNNNNNNTTTIPTTPKRPGLGRDKSSRAAKSMSGGGPLLSPAITVEDDEGHHALTPNEYLHSPYLTRNNSVISRLSSEMTSTDGEGDASQDGDGDGEGEEMRCTKCGGREFKARRVSGIQRLQCSRCGKVYEEK
ncbi:hypothetical protein SCUCBS95973_005941 [Sporothrix curviconia]|uniref:WD repeat protein n=1 Tax=Sporothrix curviconia TaxID=1260050 RepID=A0ABP0C0Y4_9PEZI